MRGDFSRLTFRRQNHYSGVRLQQGRVQLDSEFNEHVDIEEHRDRETTRDLVGPAGAPQDGGGFAVAVAARLRGVAFSTHLWTVGDDGTVLCAVRGAGDWPGDAAWTLRPAPTSGRLNAVTFPTSEVGFAVGAGATIRRLGTGAIPSGSEPETVPDDVTADLHGVHATSESSARAVGDRGTVLVWNGEDWARPETEAGVTASLRAVHFADNVGWAVGVGGTVIAGADGGATWRVQETPPGTGDLHAVYIVTETNRWAVGEQGTILSFDGTAWTSRGADLGLTETLRGVVFGGGGFGVAVGDRGTIVTTQDGGLTWAAERPEGLTADLHDVVIGPDDLPVAVGDDVTLVRDDQGTWSVAPALPVDDETGARIGRTLTLSAGDIYVDGVRCENERTVALSAQPEPPLEGTWASQPSGTLGVYLKVQQQHLTAIEREHLREVALGGPDSATRTRTVWQADLTPFGGDGDPGCADIVASLPRDGDRGRLRARAKPAAVSASDCIVPAGGGYRRLENQLYRVEIHQPSKWGAPTFKWSRDNGSVIARLQHIETRANGTGSVTVSHLGRDAMLSFGTDQIVEITDEGQLLRGAPGVMAEIDDIEGATLLLKKVRGGDGSEGPVLTLDDFPHRPIVRRWEGHAGIYAPEDAQHDPATGPYEHELEDGVFVTFTEGPDPSDSFRTGDFWTIPARTLTGAVEWPSSGGVASFEQRHGPHVSFAPLALVTAGDPGLWTSARDCRKQFPPLTSLVHMYYAGGDGQEAMPEPPDAPTVTLPQALQVGVVNGSLRVRGAAVEFSIGPGGVSRFFEGPFSPESVTVETGEDGIASCWWQLDGSVPRQIATARLIDPVGQAPPQAVVFNAHLSVASEVAYDGSGCGTLAAQGTVQQAIDALAGLTRIAPLTGSGTDILPGEDVKFEVLVADDCGPVAGATVVFEPATGNLVAVNGTTDGLGIASCTWKPDATTPTQSLTARLQSAPSPRVVHPPAETRFVVNLRLADETKYDPPENCPEMKDAVTVQAAIDRLLRLLPRLYHVSGDGLEGAEGAKIPLAAGIANRCGLAEPKVTFEIRIEDTGERDAWKKVATVQPDGDGIATYAHTLDDRPRQALRARLAGVPGTPVYFNVGVVVSGDGEGDRARPRRRAWSSAARASRRCPASGC